jgi:hypothetical protein
MRMPSSVALCMLMAMGGSALAQTPTTLEPAATISTLTVTKVGTFTGQSTSAPAEAGQQSPTRTVGTVTDWRFVSESTDIEGKVGTQFGIEFRIDGAPVGNDVTLYLVLDFPPQGIRNPNTGETLHRATVAFPNMKVGGLCLVGYGFGNAWEIVPGVWTQKISYQDHVLTERNFTISKGE